RPASGDEAADGTVLRVWNAILYVWRPGQPVSVWRGISGYPANGTGYLEIPDGNLTRFRFSFNSTPVTFFNLISFDAAEYASLGSQVLTVVGYKPQIMGPLIMVTNTFSLDGINDGTDHSRTSRPLPSIRAFRTYSRLTFSTPAGHSTIWSSAAFQNHLPAR